MIAKETVQKAKEFSQEWYPKGILPEFGTREFNQAAGTSIAFTYHLAEGNIKRIWNNRIDVEIDERTETAYIDLENGKIAVSGNFFNPDFYSNLIGDDVDDLNHFAISLINGCITHESLHAKLSAMIGNLSNFVKNSFPTKYDELLSKGFNHNAQVSTFNIVEDLYIDSQVPKELEQWLNIRAEILFSQDDLDSRAKAFEDHPSFENWFNLIALYKNKNMREQIENILSDETVDVLNLATARKEIVGNEYGRLRISRELLETFETADESENKDDSMSKSDDSGESQDSEDQESESQDSEDQESGSENADGSGESSESESTESSSSKGYENQERMDQDAGADFAQAAEETEDLDSDELETINSDVKESAEETAKKETGTETFEFDGNSISWNELIEVDILDGSVTSWRKSGIIKETIDFSFVQELVSKRTLNRTPGAARTSGTVMVKSRLSRIATDGKIFAKMDTERKTAKRIEVIINVDLSGSTEIYGILGDELSAAYEMSKALRKARISHSVYGHTSTHNEKGTIPTLIHIYSYDMQATSTNFEERFQRAQYVRTSQNYDGVVVAELREKFTGKDASKYIFNLSDGEPASRDYNGEPAIQHTMKEIAESRKRGINVISISVVSGVVPSNDRIYGREYNLNASRNISSSFKNLMSKLVP